MEYTLIEKLAIGTAIKQKLEEFIGTKNPDNIRGAADAELIERFERTGEASTDVMIGSCKVGTYSVALAKPTSERRKHELHTVDEDAYRTWAYDNGFVTIDDAAIRKHFADSGELPDGCEVREVVEPGKPGGAVKGTVLRVKSEDVIDALGGYIGPGVARLLDEAIEEEVW